MWKERDLELKIISEAELTEFCNRVSVLYKWGTI